MDQKYTKKQSCMYMCSIKNMSHSKRAINTAHIVVIKNTYCF